MTHAEFVTSLGENWMLLLYIPLFMVLVAAVVWPSKDSC